MKNRNFTLIVGVFAVLFAFMTHLSATIYSPVNDTYYNLKVDTSGVTIGYLQIDPENPGRLTIEYDTTKVASDSTLLWRIFNDESAVGNNYRILNKATLDTLAFDLFEQVDTTAVINAEGAIGVWYDLFDAAGDTDTLKAGYDDIYYFLSYGDDSIIRLSHLESSEKTALRFVIERPKVIPAEGKFYRLKVDTIGLSGDFESIGFLCADTFAITRDSLVVSDTLKGGLSLWKFEMDMVISDTTYFKIKNKLTDSLLAFALPQSDTIATIDINGELANWSIPFFVDDNGVGKFMVRSGDGTPYYLGINNDTVMLISDSAKSLKFMLEEDIIMPYTEVYKVISRNSGDNYGRYIAANDSGGLIYADEVYDYIPNGQFVVYNHNRYNLMNRMEDILHLATPSDTIVPNGVDNDTLLYVVDGGKYKPDWYTNGVDTFEIIPFDIGLNKTNPKLGYKYIAPDELSLNTYVFSQFSVDTIIDRMMGYDSSDSLVMILAESDTARFILERCLTISNGAPEIADIPMLERSSYYLRSFEDTSLYVTLRDGKMEMDITLYKTSFCLKEDSISGPDGEPLYYFVESNYHTTNAGKNLGKILVDSHKYMNFVPVDSAETHSFKIIVKDRTRYGESDGYKYLTEFPDDGKKGFYEFKIISPNQHNGRMLTKNFYDYVVSGKEGESTLRAGSYTPNDLHLWVDTARGTGFNPEKPSFYIVKGVDTTASDFRTTNGYEISGYFLHVMDSIDIAPSDKSVYTNDGGDEFYRANFVKAKRFSANEILLDTTGTVAQLRDSIGFAGKNEDAINEYRFYLQETGDESDTYHIVTEAGYGDGGRTDARGYMSISSLYSRDTIYFGPRDGANVITISFTGSTVPNEIIPPVVKEEKKVLSVIGGAGQINVLNGIGQEAAVYNILGQMITSRNLASDNELIPISRGIFIVKVGTKAHKVVVR